MRIVRGIHFFSAELDPKKPDKWDIGSTLDLTLVRRVEADGKVAWVIPVGYTATPSIGGYGQDTVTAHVEFSTDLSSVKGRARECRMGPDRDPSGTGLGLASWIATTFEAVSEDRHGGLSYTKDFEVRASAGARFGYVFTPIDVDVGLAAQATRTHRLVVAVTQHHGPQKVIIVGDQRKRGVAATGKRGAFSNPNLNLLLLKQAPVRLVPGSTLPR